MLSLDIVSWLALSMFSGFLLLFWFDHQKKWTQKLAFLTETSGDSFPLTPGLSDLPLRGTRVMTQTLCPLIGRRWERGSIHESKPCNLWVLGTVLLLTRCRLFPLRCSGSCRIARVQAAAQLSTWALLHGDGDLGVEVQLVQPFSWGLLSRKT